MSFPKNDREWARSHVGCNVTTCPNGACRLTGRCLDSSKATALRSIPHVPSPPLAHGYCSETGPAWCPTAAITVAGQCDTCPETAPRTIIAFTGLAGSGKSTAAAHLVSQRGFTRIRFAGPLKAMMAALGLTHEQIEGSEKEQPCELLGGKTPRWAMQSLGTEWGRDMIAPDLWIRAFNVALANTRPDMPVVVDDCRFPNEAAAIHKAGGVLIRIERPGAGAGAAGHSSEAHTLSVSRTIYNTGSEKMLLQEIGILVSDLSWIDHGTVDASL